MHQSFMDITDRISDPPKWWMRGVPRYCDYHPEGITFLKTNALIRVACQHCSRIFDIAIGTNADLKPGLIDGTSGRVIAEASDDPPYHLMDDGFSCYGNSEGVEWKAVLQVWQRRGAEWTRLPHLEGDLPDYIFETPVPRR